MHKYILGAVVRSDKPETLCVIEPFDLACLAHSLILLFFAHRLPKLWSREVVSSLVEDLRWVLRPQMQPESSAQPQQQYARNPCVFSVHSLRAFLQRTQLSVGAIR